MNSRYGLQLLLNEIKAHWALEHCEGVLRLLGIHEEDSTIVLVLEYQPEGSLLNLLQDQTEFTEAQVKVIMEQALLVLDFF